MKNRHFVSIFILIQAGLFFTCSTHISKNNLTRIKVKFCTPITIENDKLIGDTIIVFISNFLNYKIIELPNRVSLQDGLEVIYDTINYEYLIENITKKEGYMLKGLNDTFKLISNKDSIINSRAFKGLKGDFVETDKMGLITKGEKIGNGKLYIKKYLTTKVIYDSLYFYYDTNLKDLNFSLSKQLDIINDSKLFKIEMFIKSDSLKNAFPNAKDFFKNSIEFMIEKNNKESELLTLLNRFIKFEKQISNSDTKKN